MKALRSLACGILAVGMALPQAPPQTPAQGQVPQAAQPAKLPASDNSAPNAPASVQIPPLQPLQLRARIGVLGETTMSLPEVIQRVLANDRDLEISRTARETAALNLQAAQGIFDPSIGFSAFRTRSVTPIASLIGGAANGKLTQTQVNATPYLSGLSPWTGGTFRLDFNSARQISDSQFLVLNPQYPSSVNLNLRQPLWRGLRFDENRYRMQVARRNQNLTDEQFRQRVIEIVTQAVRAYWELDYTRRNVEVQLEAVRLAERQYESNRRQAEQGLLAAVDVIAAQTQIATFQQTLFQAEEALTRSENALKMMMLPDRRDLLWGVALVPETPPSDIVDVLPLDEAVQRALRLRPELAQAAVSIELNALDTRLNRERTRPQIDLVGTFTAAGLSGRPLPPAPNPFTGATETIVARVNQLSATAGLSPIPTVSFGAGNQLPTFFIGGYNQTLSTLTAGNFPTAQFGLEVSVPLRNRAAAAQVSISAVEGRRLQASRAQIELLIEADVRNSLQAVSSSQARLEAAVLARRSADDQYASEQRQFQAGTSTVFLVLQRQTELINARSREVRARIDVQQAAAELDRATARTIEVRNINLTNP